jgi:hypothetical protein
MRLAFYQGKYWKLDDPHVENRFFLTSLADTSAGVLVCKEKVRIITGRELTRQVEAIDYFERLQRT